MPDNRLNMASLQQGFSLLELLVVVVILSILTGVVGLTYFQSAEQKMAKQATELRDQLVAVRDTAILQGRPYAIVFSRDKYSILTLDRENKLVPANDPGLQGTNHLPDGYNFTGLTLPQFTDEETRGLLIDTTGLLPPFEIGISDSNQTVSLTNTVKEGLRVVYPG